MRVVEVRHILSESKSVAEIWLSTINESTSTEDFPDLNLKSAPDFCSVFIGLCTDTYDILCSNLPHVGNVSSSWFQSGRSVISIW